MRAILSVSDKTGLTGFARGLHELGWELFSTGGTQRSLRGAAIPVHSVSDLTGFPEVLDGRVKTLHPAVHAGILARRDVDAHMKELEREAINPIDLVAVNLYPFIETVSRDGVSLEEALENVDIGGPTMLRAAAKNFPHVIAVVDPADYPSVLEGLRGRGDLSLAQRRWLAYKAFQHVSFYDTAVAAYLRGGDATGFPRELTVALHKAYDLRYGENPHQQGAFYRELNVLHPRPWGINAAEQLHGRELSYNNLLDADAAWAAVNDYREPTVAIVKHTNPCGLASHDDLAEAYRRALAGDPVSAYGGIVASNRALTVATAEAMKGLFFEVVLAPEFEPDAVDLLKKRRDLRILRMAGSSPPADVAVYRQLSGGMLVQTPDTYPDDEIQPRVVTRRAPTPEELADLRFAWKAVKHVKSNAIVLARERALVGMGAGQPNRVTSVHLAVRAAGERAQGSVLASDAFFPFRDSVDLAAGGGVTAIIQPGGSIRDPESIEAADGHGMAMIFTGIRHFKH